MPRAVDIGRVGDAVQSGLRAGRERSLLRRHRRNHQLAQERSLHSGADGRSTTPWANLPGACVSGASTEAPFTTGLAANASGSPLEQLALIGCYMVNGSAIVPPAQGTYGTMVPDQIKGPGQSLTNLSVFKNWKIKERLDTQFRFEMFNVFNRTQYAGGGVNLGSPNTFGLATNTPDVTKGDAINAVGGPRYIQFGLKLLF